MYTCAHASAHTQLQSELCKIKIVSRAGAFSGSRHAPDESDVQDLDEPSSLRVSCSIPWGLLCECNGSSLPFLFLCCPYAVRVRYTTLALFWELMFHSGFHGNCSASTTDRVLLLPFYAVLILWLIRYTALEYIKERILWSALARNELNLALWRFDSLP